MRQAAETIAANGRAPVRVLRVSTDDWPEADRVAMFRENVGRDRVVVEALAGDALRIDSTFIQLPQLTLVSARRSALRSDFADANDRLTINLGGEALASQGGREFVLGPGDAVAFTSDEIGSITTGRSGRLATMEFMDGGLRRMLGSPRQSSALPIAAKTPALLLLRRYVAGLWTSDVLETSAVRSIAIEHIRDLAALAVGSNHAAEEIAAGRGVRAARLHAVKQDIVGRLQEELTLRDIAARHRLSERYVRMLFESEGTSFSEFVRHERLKRARRMLLKPGSDHRLISDIAYEVGFNDLSYFNRSFRRRFGMSPRDLRAFSREGA